MKDTHLNGALLEFIVRNILLNCGFTNVKEDKLYSFKSRGLFFVNGKGAAHDADVFMNPPIQIPFAYPTQLIFECKGYSKTIGLPIVRNVLGFRNDINDFEIVTKDFIKSRQNNRRKLFAVETRRRFIYQIGVASFYGFKKTAIEFAINNKIPLLSLSWFLNKRFIESIFDKTQQIVKILSTKHSRELYSKLKNNDSSITNIEHYFSDLVDNNIIRDLFRDIRDIIDKFFIMILETGDLVFAHTSNPDVFRLIRNSRNVIAEFHFNELNPTLWTLTMYDSNNTNEKYISNFYLPSNIVDHWLKFNYDKNAALNIKENYFSKFLIFSNNPENPLKVVNINKEWLEKAKNKLIENIENNDIIEEYDDESDDDLNDDNEIK